MAYLFNNGTSNPELLFNGVHPVCCVYNNEIVWLHDEPVSYRVYIELNSTDTITINGMSYNGYACTTADFFTIGANPDASYSSNGTWQTLDWIDVSNMIDYGGALGYQQYCDAVTFQLSAYDERFSSFQFKTNQNYQPTVTAKITVNEFGTQDSKTVASKNVVLQPNTTYTINRGEFDT